MKTFGTIHCKNQHGTDISPQVLWFSTKVHKNFTVGKDSQSVVCEVF